MRKNIDEIQEVKKYNENHDSLGRFSSGKGSAAASGGGPLGSARNMIQGAKDNTLIDMWNKSKEDMSTEGIAINSLIETELENRNLIKLNEDTFEYELINNKPAEAKPKATPTNMSNTGVQLTKEQNEYFKDSAVRDEKGNLLTLYHNSPVEGIEEFTTQNKAGYGGLYMSDTKSVATGYGGKATYEVYVDMKKPFEVDAQGKMHDSIETPPEMKTSSGKTVDTFEIAAWARKNGYDGVMIKNVKEPSSREIGTDVIAFNPEQIKSTSNKNPSSSKNINKRLDIIEHIEEENK